jgi:DNA-binding Lrp family transcriptional regulator
MSPNQHQLDILRAIANGQTSQEEIADTLKLDKSFVGYYLDEMKNSGYIQGAKGFGINVGPQEYLTVSLTYKGKVAAKNPQDLIQSESARSIHTDGGPYNEINAGNNSNIGVASDFTARGNSTVNIGSTLNNHNQSGNISIMQSGNFGIGHMSGGEIQSGAKVAGVINEAQQQDLAQAAAEIQKLLEQLEKSYPANTTTGKMQIATEAISQIDRNPALTARILSALKAGSVSAFEQFLNHPAASFVISALQDWQETKGS